MREKVLVNASLIKWIYADAFSSSFVRFQHTETREHFLHEFLILNSKREILLIVSYVVKDHIFFVYLILWCYSRFDLGIEFCLFDSKFDVLWIVFWFLGIQKDLFHNLNSLFSFCLIENQLIFKFISHKTKDIWMKTLQG